MRSTSVTARRIELLLRLPTRTSSAWVLASTISIGSPRWASCPKRWHGCLFVESLFSLPALPATSVQRRFRFSFGTSGPGQHPIDLHAKIDQLNVQMIEASL